MSEEDLRIFNPYETKGLQRIDNVHDGGYVVHGPSFGVEKILCSIFFK